MTPEFLSASSNAQHDVTGVPDLTLAEIGACAILVCVPIGIWRFLGIGLEGRFLLAAVRAALQLFWLGYVMLKPLFQIRSMWLVMGYLLLMVTIASMEAWVNATYRYNGLFRHVFTSVSFGLVGVLSFAVILVLPSSTQMPWWEPRLIIPIAGMLLGNAISATMIGLDSVLTEIFKNIAVVELRLSMGASVREALLPAIKAGFKSGLTPSMNQMSVVGLVAIPGMMTGQILGGQDPATAACYQLAILYLLAVTACTCLGISTFLAVRAVADVRSAHQRFHVARLVKRKGAKQDLLRFFSGACISMCQRLKEVGVLQKRKLPQELSGSGRQYLNLESGIQDKSKDAAGLAGVVQARISEKAAWPPPLAGQRLQIESLQVAVADHESDCGPERTEQKFRPLLAHPLSITLAPGEILCVMGTSGVGKTRLLRTIAALDEASDGVVKLMREPVDAKTADTAASIGAVSWRRYAAYVPQNIPAIQGSPMDFLEEVCSLRARASCTQEKLSDRYVALAEEFGLAASVLQSPWGELSGGERHRSMLALVVALDPHVLIIDEPTSACDASTSAMVEAALVREALEGLTIIWVTHDATQAARVAHRQLDLVATVDA